MHFSYQSGFKATHTATLHRCVLQREAGTVWGFDEKYVVTDLIYRRRIFRNEYRVINVIFSPLWDGESATIWYKIKLIWWENSFFPPFADLLSSDLYSYFWHTQKKKEWQGNGVLGVKHLVLRFPPAPVCLFTGC